MPCYFRGHSIQFHGRRGVLKNGADDDTGVFGQAHFLGHGTVEVNDLGAEVAALHLAEFDE